MCGAQTDRRLLAKSCELRPPVSELIVRSGANWRPEQGLCPACVLRYHEFLVAQRSPLSLHTTTEPHTTFPYYHPAEETVLGQPERLPDYHTFGGQGVTIAFLDSGYYPHPDLSRTPSWPDPQPAWSQLDVAALRAVLEGADLRLLHYVDLTDGEEAEGLDLPSLWDGAGYSWHGQMTTTLAAGNGLLSNGRFRGYAPAAHLLPIKIGRSNGRIPEEDILAGFNWLLRKDNWLRYGVRVVNVAVGGDFRELWYKNPVCLAAEELSRRGVLVCAAAGNSGRDELVAPAQAPSVLTVGGVADQNRRWQPLSAADVDALELYHHNYGVVIKGGQRLRKPELLALGRWLPAPILPPTPVLREVHTIGELRRVLQASDPYPLVREPEVIAWMSEVWEAVRKRMNAHKWVHPYYQHVDGTSVAVAQISAVAAQMFEANPSLSGAAVKELLLTTALPLAQKSAKLSGRGLLQPTLAVAAALRANGGPLLGYPRSATLLTPGELQNWLIEGKVSYADLVNADQNDLHPVYLGFYAPQATQVSLTGSFNRWQPDGIPLRRRINGWWQLVIFLPGGQHLYRFWVETEQRGVEWQADPENPLRGESGYIQDHSLLIL